jgi:hypothetical protein
MFCNFTKVGICSLESIHFYDQNIGYVTGDCGQIIHTIEGGSTWTNQVIRTVGSSLWLYSSWFTDANTGYVTGSNGTILKTTDGGVTWMSGIQGSTVLKISPNPATELISIEFPDFVSIKETKNMIHIYNVTGNEVLTMYSIGNKTDLQVGDLPSGLYFVKVTGRSKVFVGKFIME